MKTKVIILFFFVLAVNVSAKKPKKEIFSQENYGISNTGTAISVEFVKGKEHNHPLFAIWLADEQGKFIQTLYLSQSVGKGKFEHGSRGTGKWLAGEIQRPAALPFWAHQRGIKNEFGTFLPSPKYPEVDAYTGATPHASFTLNVKTEKPLRGKYKVLLEVNQTWDWNEFWTNDKFPDDKEYKTSSQPALVYVADIDSNTPAIEIVMKPMGHSHYSGKDGSINTNLSTITTALKIAKKITVKVQ